MSGCRDFLLGALIAAMVSAGTLFSYGSVIAADPGHALLAEYADIKPKLEKNQFNAPIYLESSENRDALRVDMYGTFDHPFDSIRDALRSPADWCDITPLDLNIKACTWKKVRDQWFLTLYSGRKYYQPPADAYLIKFRFQVLTQRPDFLDLALTADQGPLGTRDHRIRLQAVPLEAGKTMIHFSYSYSHGRLARMAIKTYFATLGRDKVGFSLVPGKGGRLVYIGGVRGALERNALRYYLALETYVDTLRFPEAQRFEQRASRWYDLTAKYPRQLKEDEKGEYLAMKRRERNNQIIQQRKDG